MRIAEQMTGGGAAAAATDTLTIGFISDVRARDTRDLMRTIFIPISLRENKRSRVFFQKRHLSFEHGKLCQGREDKLAYFSFCEFWEIVEY